MASDKKRMWKGHVMTFDQGGWRVARVILPESVVAQYMVSEEAPNTRASAVGRIEVELTTDDFTMERGVWKR